MAAGDLSFFYVAGQLGSSIGDIYEIPAGKTLMHAELILCNTDASTAYRVDAHITDASKTASAANQILNQETGITDISSGETQTMQINQHPPAGYWFRGLASTASKVTYFLSGELREN